MRVKVEVEFDVSPVEGEEEGFCATAAKRAAESAIYHNLALTEDGHGVVQAVRLHVDGFGECVVEGPK